MSRKLRFAIGFLGLFSLFSLVASPVVEARLLPRAMPKKSSTGVAVASKGVATSVRFRNDRRAIVASFTKLSVAKSVAYTLTYDSAGVTQGASGSVMPGVSEPAVRELVFGTCSGSVCRYHTGIKNAKLVITTTLKTGKKVVKTFRIKV